MSEAKQRLAKRYGYLTVAALVLTSFIPLSLGLSCAGIFYPSVAADLGVGTGVMSYYTSFIWLSSTIFLSLMGRLLHKMDARVVLSAAVALMALMFVWLSFASALWQFYVGAFFMGLGVSMLLFLAPSTLINRWFAQRAGFLLGIVMAFTGVGGVVWSAVGGSLILELGWAATYRVFAGLCALTLLATVLMVSNGPKDKGLLPVGYVASEGGSRKGADASSGAAAAGAGAPAVVAEGVPAEKAFKMPVFFLIMAMVFLLNFGMYVYFIIPSYISSQEISVAMPLLGAMASSVAMAGQTVSKLVFGFVGDKHPHACVIAGLALGIVGVALLASGAQVALVVYAAALAFGVYYGVTNVMSPIVTRLNFGDAEYPRIYSRISTGAAVGNMASALMWGALIDLTGGYDVLFVGVIVLLAVTIGLAVMVKKKGNRDFS